MLYGSLAIQATFVTVCQSKHVKGEFGNFSAQNAYVTNTKKL